MSSRFHNQNGEPAMPTKPDTRKTATPFTDTATLRARAR